MKKRLSDFVIMSDVDGTLINADGQIPARNLAAVQRFTQAGGKFGIATGRSKELTRELAAAVGVNSVCVLYNGGALYDFAKEEFIMRIYLPDQARAYVAGIMQRFPDIGVMVVSNTEYYNVTQELDFALHRERTVTRTDISCLTDSWYKVLFLIGDGQYDEFMRYCGAQAFEGVRVVGTNHRLMEMLPLESSKGYALEQLIERTELARENLVAIGDYFNDLEMIELAGIGATLNTSPEELQHIADLVVGDCENGAVADLIEYLEANFSE